MTGAWFRVLPLRQSTGSPWVAFAAQVAVGYCATYGHFCFSLHALAFWLFGESMIVPTSASRGPFQGIPAVFLCDLVLSGCGLGVFFSCLRHFSWVKFWVCHIPSSFLAAWSVCPVLGLREICKLS